MAELTPDLLLSTARAEGDPAINTLLSPFKVRLPRSLTPLLKIEDALWLELRKVDQRKESWVPVQSGYVPSFSLSFPTTSLTSSSFLQSSPTLPVRPLYLHPSLPSLVGLRPSPRSSFLPTQDDTGAAESDIDPSQYREELDRLLREEGTEANDEEVRFNREVLDMLQRAKNLLGEGELED